MPIGVVGDADPAGLGDVFQPCSDVDAISEDITLFDHDVADVDAHANFDALVCRHLRIALRHAALLLDGAAHGIHRAGELDQNSVSGAFDNAASVSRDIRFQKFTAVGVEPGEGAFLIGAHQPTVASNIPRKDGRKPPLYTMFCHAVAPRSNTPSAAEVYDWQVRVSIGTIRPVTVKLRNIATH